MGQRARLGWLPLRLRFLCIPEHNNERYELISMDRIEREFNAIRDAGTGLLMSSVFRFSAL